MEELIRNIFSEEHIKVPGKISAALRSKFGKGAVSVEWSQKDSFYEAVFYLNQVEHIARFSNSGELIDYRVNLAPDELSSAILGFLSGRGEVMNVVAVHTPHNEKGIVYEIILRNRDLVRYELLIDQDGKLLSEKLL